MTITKPIVCEVARTAFLSVSGQDAGTFLNAQLSQDTGKLELTRASLAGWHDPRGRVKALFRVIKQPDSWILMTNTEIAATVKADLERFILRADVEIESLDAWEARALIGDADNWLREQGIDLSTRTNAVVTRDELTWLRVGPGVVYAIGHAAAFPDRLRPTPQSADITEFAEIGLGIPLIDATSAGRFVPHMMNLVELGAIAFDKGCYPGQEIIARTENLGSVKRVAMAFEGQPTTVKVGDELVDRQGKSVGVVIRFAHAHDRMRILAIVQRDAADAELALRDDPANVLIRITPSSEDDGSR